MNNQIDIKELDRIEQFMIQKNCISMTSSKYRTDLLFFLVNNAVKGQYVCEVGPYKGGLTAQLAYICKQLGKKLIVCEIVQECADIVRENLIELGYGDIVKIYVMPFVDFVAQNNIPHGTILTIIDANHIYPYALQNFQAFRAIRNNSYAVAFHDFGLRDTDNIMGVERAVRETFPNDTIYYIGSNTSFTPCKLHTTPAEDKTFFCGSEGALIVLPPLQMSENATILALQEKFLDQSRTVNSGAGYFKQILKKLFVSEKIANVSDNNTVETPLTVDFDFVDLTYGIFGKFFTLKHDMGVGKAIRETGCWAWDHVKLFKQIIKEGDTVFDVGANVGHHSVCFSKIVGDSGKVFAFEPQLPLFHILCANAMINTCTNIYPFRSVIGEKNGSVELPIMDYKSDENFGAMCIKNNEYGDKHQIIKYSIDDFVNNPLNLITSVDFIKIDVQTFEFYVLQGARETLQKYKPSLLIEISPYWMKHINNYDYREIYRLLQSLDYIIFTPNFILEKNIPDFPIDESSAKIEWDILAVHKNSQFYKRFIQQQ